MALPEWLSQLLHRLPGLAKGPTEETTEDSIAGVQTLTDQEPLFPPEEELPPSDMRPWWRRRWPRIILGGCALGGLAWLGLSWYLAAPPPAPPGSLLTAPPRLAAPKPGSAPLPSAPSLLPKDVEVAEPPRPELPVTTRPTPASPPVAELPPPLPSAAPAPSREAGLLAEEVVRMSYTLTLAERQARLAELRARQQKADTERAKAEADAKEAAMWAQLLERNPRLILKARHAEDSPVVTPPKGPWPAGSLGPLPSLPTPPAPSRAPGSGKEGKEPPRPELPPAAASPPPRPLPLVETIHVRLIDRSAPQGPEALLAVGGEMISVRTGDRVGAWQIVEVTPTGVRLLAQSDQAREEQWRPLLAPFAQRGSAPSAPGPSDRPPEKAPPARAPARPTPARPSS